MGILDLLGSYREPPQQPPPQVFDDFDHVAEELSPDELGDGIEEAFRSEATPPFEQMVGQLYERSDPQMRAGLLNEILGSLAGGGASTLAGGALGGILQQVLQGRSISPREVQDIPVNEVERAAAHARRHNPSVMQRVGRAAARNPQLVHTLGRAALAIALSSLARRRRI